MARNRNSCLTCKKKKCTIESNEDPTKEEEKKPLKEAKLTIELIFMAKRKWFTYNNEIIKKKNRNNNNVRTNNRVLFHLKGGMCMVLGFFFNIIFLLMFCLNVCVVFLCVCVCVCLANAVLYIILKS